MNTRSFLKSVGAIVAGCTITPALYFLNLKTQRSFTEEEFDTVMKQLEPHDGWIDNSGDADWDYMLVTPGFYAAFTEGEQLSDSPKVPHHLASEEVFSL